MYVRLFDGSYFRSLLYFLTFGFKKKPKTHCTACLYGMLSRIILLIRGATALLPESECKGIAFSWTTKQLEEKIQEKREKKLITQLLVRNSQNFRSKTAKTIKILAILFLATET